MIRDKRVRIGNSISQGFNLAACSDYRVEREIFHRCLCHRGQTSGSEWPSGVQSWLDAGGSVARI
jgi:hypothetical protein